MRMCMLFYTKCIALDNFLTHTDIVYYDDFGIIVIYMNQRTGTGTFSGIDVLEITWYTFSCYRSDHRWHQFIHFIWVSMLGEQY